MLQNQEILEIWCNIRTPLFAFYSLQQLVQWPRPCKYFGHANSNSEPRDFSDQGSPHCLSRNAPKKGTVAVEPYRLLVRWDTRM